MNAISEGIRKAAILVDTLDAPAADALLERMTADQADLVRRTVVELGPIDPRERKRVVAEFLDVTSAPAPRQPAGIELDGRLARRLVERARPTGALPPTAESADGSPFGFLQRAREAEIGRILAEERPQTIALVLSHLPPKQAADVLVQFPPAAQSEIIRRLLDLEETDPEILREVEHGLRERLAQQVPLERRRVAGAAAVAGMLRAATGSVSRRILDNLATHDRQLAERFTPARPEVNPVAFDDLATFSSAALETLAETAGPELLALALVGAPPILADRLLRQLPYHRSRAIRQELDHPGPTRLSDVEAARLDLAELAWTLASQERIELPGVGERAERTGERE